MFFLSLYEKWLALFNKKGKNYNDMFNLDGLVNYWSNELLGRMQRIFVWEGLPFPPRELENLLLINGYCSQVESKLFKVSRVGVAPCTYSGVTEYPDIGKQVDWTNSLDSGRYKLNSDDGVLIRNNSLSQGVMPFITRYAILLANTDISLVQALINERDPSLILANNSNTVDAINKMYDNLERGKRRAVLMDNLFQSVQGAIALPTLTTKDSIKPILQAYDGILQMFYNDIGIRYNKDKKERMVESEVTSDSQRLLMNVTDMLNCREEAAPDMEKMIRRVYGNSVKVSVRLSNEIVLVENNQTVQPANNQPDNNQSTETITTAEELKENVDYSF